MTKLAKKWKKITKLEYKIAILTDTLTPEHSEMIMAILNSNDCSSLDSCGFVSLYVAKKYNLIYFD